MHVVLSSYYVDVHSQRGLCKYDGRFCRRNATLRARIGLLRDDGSKLYCLTHCYACMPATMRVLTVATFAIYRGT
jgi:hypothetical protein